MPRVMTLGRAMPTWRMSMRQTVDPLLYHAGQPALVGLRGLGTPGEPVWNMPNGWGPRPPAYPDDNLLRPSSGGCGPTDPRCHGGNATVSGLGSMLRGATSYGLGAIGQIDDVSAATTSSPELETVRNVAIGSYILWSAVGVVGTAMGAYHGYKRNNGSVGYAVLWALLGGIFPIIVIPVALAQGFGKRKGR